MVELNTMTDKEIFKMNGMEFVEWLNNHPLFLTYLRAVRSVKE